MDDKSILDTIREGNTLVFKEFYSFYPSIKSMIISNSGTEQDAEDIFHEALIVFYRKAQEADFRLTSAIKTYVYSICKNMWLTRLRKEHKIVSEPFVVPDEAIDFEFEIDIKLPEDYEIINEVLNSVGEMCNKLLSYFYFERWNMTKIANELSYSSEQVARQQKYRCILKARKLLEAKEW